MKLFKVGCKIKQSMRGRVYKYYDVQVHASTKYLVEGKKINVS